MLRKFHLLELRNLRKIDKKKKKNNITLFSPNNTAKICCITLICVQMRKSSQISHVESVSYNAAF